MNNKLFVGNLSFNTTENDLQDAFAAFGTVVETNLMVDRVTSRPRGFGFVTMGTAEEAQKAIDGMNGRQVDGRALTVQRGRHARGADVDVKRLHAPQCSAATRPRAAAAALCRSAPWPVKPR